MNYAPRIVSIQPVHLGRGVGSRIEVTVELTGLKSRPIEVVVLDHSTAMRLLEQLAMSINRVEGRQP